jgi:hypothetical protein
MNNPWLKQRKPGRVLEFVMPGLVPGIPVFS